MKTPLTEAEIKALDEGTRVVVLWSGGNGPHEYVVHQCRGETYVHDEGEQMDSMRHYNPLGDFIGDAPPFTVVHTQGGEEG